MRLRLPAEEVEYGAYSSINLAYTSTTHDAVNLPGPIRRHFEPGKVICEPLSLMTETVTTLSICDRLPDLGKGFLSDKIYLFRPEVIIHKDLLQTGRLLYIVAIGIVQTILQQFRAFN